MGRDGARIVTIAPGGSLAGFAAQGSGEPRRNASEGRRHERGAHVERAGQAGQGPERQLDADADELEQRIDRLDEHIDDARQELRARQDDAEIASDVGGDWEDSDDDAGGEDPMAFDDPERMDEDEEA
jgi:TolA-binding protein